MGSKLGPARAGRRAVLMGAIVRGLWVGILAIVPITARADSPTGLTRPNVLFIAVDDLRPALACHGDPRAVTPHMDRLARSGIAFRRAYFDHWGLQYDLQAMRRELAYVERYPCVGLTEP